MGPHLALVGGTSSSVRDGAWLARMLREEMELAIVFITPGADRALPAPLGVQPDGYVAKPFTREGVNAAILGAANAAGARQPAPPDPGDQRGAPPGAGLSRAVLARVNRHLERRFDTPVRIEELAAIAGLTPSHFIVQYRRAAGMTPYQRLISIRMAHARDLLECTAAPLEEIAAQVGYESASHFATLFKRETGITPGQYRRSLFRDDLETSAAAP
jgi:AraC-like DNA-binding protein